MEQIREHVGFIFDTKKGIVIFRVLEIFAKKWTKRFETLMDGVGRGVGKQARFTIPLRRILFRGAKFNLMLKKLN